MVRSGWGGVRYRCRLLDRVGIGRGLYDCGTHYVGKGCVLQVI